MIKTFENFNNDFYFRIEPDEYFEDLEIEVIDEKTSNLIKKKFLSYVNDNIEFEESKPNRLIIYLYNYHNKVTEWTIEELPDEWFIVRISETRDDFYKCDQLDGLMKLITDQLT